MRLLAPIVAAIMLAGCAGGSPSAAPTADDGGSAVGPEVVIESPPGNAQVLIGQPIEVVTTAVDPAGITRIDLVVDGAPVSSATAPRPERLFRAVHVWTPATVGSVELRAVAFREDGASSEPRAIHVDVLPEGATAAPFATYSGPLPTYRALPVPSGYEAPTYNPDATQPAVIGGGPTPTISVPRPTATYHANPTPTYQPTASPTYQPTPTVAPTASVAPLDSDLHWSIPYNASGEISNLVSYPAGDTEDKVFWQVTGLSNSPPGDHGTLNVFATCEGTGTAYLTFQLAANGPKFGCGSQVIVQQLVTSEANTGLIRVYATGNAYVRWTLSGNVAP